MEIYSLNLSLKVDISKLAAFCCSVFSPRCFMVLLIIICDGSSDMKIPVALPFGLLFFNLRQCSSRSYCKTLVIPLAFSETSWSSLHYVKKVGPTQNIQSVREPYISASIN